MVLVNMGNDTSSVRISTDEECRPSTAVVKGVVAVTNVEPTEGPQLYEYVAPDALDQIFAGRDGGKVLFEYAGCQVTILNDTAVIVDPD